MQLMHNKWVNVDQCFYILAAHYQLWSRHLSAVARYRVVKGMAASTVLGMVSGVYSVF